MHPFETHETDCEYRNIQEFDEATYRVTVEFTKGSRWRYKRTWFDVNGCALPATEAGSLDRAVRRVPPIASLLELVDFKSLTEDHKEIVTDAGRPCPGLRKRRDNEPVRADKCWSCKSAVTTDPGWVCTLCKWIVCHKCARCDCTNAYAYRRRF